MRRNKYPDNRRDRIIFWFFLLGIAIEVGLAISVSPWWLLLLVVQGYGIIGTLEPSAGAVENFNDGRQRIRELRDISIALGEIMKFTESLERKIQDTQVTRKQLNRETENLSHILDTAKPKVDAILGAYISRAKKGGWREIVIGFVVGVTSSLVASLVWQELSLRGITWK